MIELIVVVLISEWCGKFTYMTYGLVRLGVTCGCILQS